MAELKQLSRCYTDIQGLEVCDADTVELLNACHVTEEQMIGLLGRRLAKVDGCMLSVLSQLQNQIAFYETRGFGQDNPKDNPDTLVQLHGFGS
jgi:hypothetical protein